ncbi:hypothetical protein CHS0354_004197 [Potamilus streckersoni]|uniref:Eukaryotic translation initiation factor 5A n=1 Tax=Potamilus streckersoni TaxID=2493646 RepID=A0AAE0SZJ9_9BIVA|nr:hypothetical protein CHS0354_004197 [Potamilus streckersoni]
MKCDSGASKTFPIRCYALHKNAHVFIKDRPCKIADMTTAKTGKHGHAKIHLIAFNIFTGKRHEDICPSAHNINNVPNVSRSEYSLVNISHDHYCSIVDDAGLPRSDLKLPDGEHGNEIKKTFRER